MVVSWLAFTTPPVSAQSFNEVAPETYQRPRLDDFFGGSEFVDAQVSLNGRVLATAKYVGSQSAIELFDMTEARTRRAGGLDMPFYANSITWKDANRLILSGDDKEGRNGVWVWNIGEAKAQKLFRFDAEDDDYAPDPKFDTSEARTDFYLKRGDAMRAKPRPDTSWLVSILRSDPGKVLIGARKDNVERLILVDLASLESKVLDEADTGYYANWFISADGLPLIRREQSSTGSSVRLVRLARGGEAATTLAEFPFEEHAGFDVIGPSPKPDHVLVRARREGEDKAAIYEYDVVKRQFSAALVRSDRYDLADAIIDDSNRLIAGVEAGRGSRFVAVDPADRARFEDIRSRAPAGSVVSVLSTASGDGLWTLQIASPTDPGSLWVHDSRFNRMLKIGQIDRVLDGKSIGQFSWMDYKARDGLDLEALLITPVGAQDTNMPLVVLPHGGPHGVTVDHDWDRLAAFIASRGYLVIQPNFRGSGGKGRAFGLAGYRQWGKAMQNDLTDAVQSLVAAGKVDPKRVAIVGGSYGGYAALAGAALTPDVYQCAASLNGVPDLNTQLAWVAARRDAGSQAFWKRTIGDPATDQASINAVSPLQQVSRIQIPILLLVGDRDDVVDPKGSQLMFDALKAAGKQARLVRFPRMKHSPTRYTDTANFYGEIDYFLANCIGPQKLTSGAPANRAHEREALVISDTMAPVPPPPVK